MENGSAKCPMTLLNVTKAKPSIIAKIFLSLVFIAIFNSSLFLVAATGLQIQKVNVPIAIGIEAQNCLPPQNLTRSIKLHLITEPSISCRCG